MVFQALKVRGSRLALALLAPVLLWATGCRKPAGGAPSQEVVIYTALDQIYSEPILKRFEAQSGIKVRPVYDSEAAKTTGLVSRLIAEAARPRCDVFWNNEIMQTLLLKRKGLLEPYVSPAAAAIPASFKDPAGQWTGFAARARVLAYNTKLVKAGEVPHTLPTLVETRWRGKIAMAYPAFGTTASHAATIFALWGRADALQFFKALQTNGVKIMEGNGAACRAVADGELPLALTDSDDANLARTEGKPVAWVAIEDGRQPGGLLIPNTLALIKGAPNADAGRKLIDFLLSPEVEAALAASPSAQIPLRSGIAMPVVVQELARARFIDAPYEKAAAVLPECIKELEAVFARP